MRAKRTKTFFFCGGQFVVHRCDFPKCGDFFIDSVSQVWPRVCGKTDVGDSDMGDRVLYVMEYAFTLSS
jgi:hypothetical protein